MEAKIAPVINKFWEEDAFPFDLLPAGVRDLNIAGLRIPRLRVCRRQHQVCRLRRDGIARVDCSSATFFGVHSGLAMGPIFLCGSETAEKWLPPMARMEEIGSFGLTQPDVGSGASGGLTTTAKREGDTWVLNGQKKWIGERNVGRHHDYLGARSGPQSGQGIHRRE